MHFGLYTHLDELKQEINTYNKSKKEKFEFKSLSKGSEDTRINAMLDFKNKASKILTEY